MMRALACALALCACQRPVTTVRPHEADWWRNAVFYEVYPRSFQDTSGDGIGDLAGVTDRLDYLAELGVDAIWLTPFYPSPQVDFGYDVSNYVDVDPQFGTLADFDRLIREAHRRNIRIIVDLVLNHTSDQHPWFRDSRSSRQSKYRDFYIWRDGKDHGPPSNWASVFGPEAWTFDKTTGQWYYHAFYAQQPDLNWRNPKVEQAISDVMRFWLDRGVDGFRLDAVANLFEDPALHDNPVLPALRKGSKTEHEQVARYNYHLPEVHDALQRLRKIVDAYPGRVLISEDYVDRPADLVRYYGDGGGPEIHLPFNFFLTGVEHLSAPEFRKMVDDSEQALGGRPTTWPLSNHDRVRAVSRFGDGVHDEAIAKLLGALLLTLRGAPFLYYGEEIGMHNHDPKRIEDVRDPIGRQYWPVDKGRDGERTPMQWDAGGGFSSGKPWLPMGSDTLLRNVARESAAPNSVLSFYRRLLRLRRSNAALLDGGYASVGDDPNVFAYRRGQNVMIALNFSAEPQSITLPGVSGGTVLLSSVRASGQFESDTISLGGYEALIIGMR